MAPLAFDLVENVRQGVVGGAMALQLQLGLGALQGQIGLAGWRRLVQHLEGLTGMAELVVQPGPEEMAPGAAGLLANGIAGLDEGAAVPPLGEGRPAAVETVPSAGGGVGGT